MKPELSASAERILQERGLSFEKGARSKLYFYDGKTMVAGTALLAGACGRRVPGCQLLAWLKLRPVQVHAQTSEPFPLAIRIYDKGFTKIGFFEVNGAKRTTFAERGDFLREQQAWQHYARWGLSIPATTFDEPSLTYRQKAFSIGPTPVRRYRNFLAALPIQIDEWRPAASGATAIPYGWYHGDLSPNNVLATDEGDFVIDFDRFGYGFALFDACFAFFQGYIELSDFLHIARLRIPSVAAMDERALFVFLEGAYGATCKEKAKDWNPKFAAELRENLQRRREQALATLEG